VAKCSPANWIRYWAKLIGERNAVVFSSAVATLPFEEVWKYRRLKADNVFIFTLTFTHEGLREGWIHKGKQPLDVFYLGASYLVSFHLRGARALIEDIAPVVLEKAPGAFRFHICGSKLPKELREQCDGTHIIYEGYVDNFDEFLEKMDIGAFPVWTGKVMKGKVFESLCRAFPIVIPKNCLGGYELRSGNEMLLAETPNEFIESIISLQDEALRKKLSYSAARFAEENFSHKALTNILATILERAIS
jgi:glycosyltransferase involved in cell wall biosynthesis